MSSRFIMPFADVGSGIKPSSGAKLFFFELDGVTPKNTFSDQLASPTANTNPVISDSNGVFGDIYINGDYKITLQNKNGTQIFGGVIVKEVGEAASINNLTLPYVFNTVALMQASTIVFPVGKRIEFQGYYAQSDGGDNWGIVKSGTHTDDGGSIFTLADGKYVEANIKGRLNLLKFGGKSEVGFENALFFNKMVSYAVRNDLPDFFDNIVNGSAKEPHRLYVPKGRYQVYGTVLIPSGISLDLGRSTLYGNLNITPTYTNANTMFESAFINASGNVQSNLTQPLEVGRCVNASVFNGSIIECYIGLELKNFNENSQLHDLIFYDCATNFKSFRGFYSTYRNMFSRVGNAAIIGATEASYDFLSSTNAIDCYNINTVGRKVGMLINGASGEGTRAMSVRKCGFEECEVGIQNLFSMQPVSFVDNYFEFCSVTGLDLSNCSAQYVDITSNWFGTCGTGVKAVSSQNMHIDKTNAFISCSTDVSWGSDIESEGTVGITPTNLPNTANDLRPSIPAKYTLGKKLSVEHPVFIFDNSTGLPLVKHNYTEGLIDLSYTGDAGVVPGKVPYCELAFSVPSTGAVDVFVATKIPYNKWSSLIFRFEIADNTNTHEIQGRVQGLSIFYDGGTQTYPVIVFDQGGFIRFQISGFSGSGSVAVTGIIRHV